LSNASFHSTSLLKLINVRAFDNDVGENARLNYFLTETETDESLLKIDQLNGTLYFDYSNLTHQGFNTFKRILNVSIQARDCGTPSLSTSINLTLFLNYDSSELPEYVYNRLQSDNSFKINSMLIDSLKKSERFELEYSYNSKKRSMNLLQLILNNFLLVFLLIILSLMMFVTCFVFATIYFRSPNAKSSKSSSINQPSDASSRSVDASSSGVNCSDIQQVNCNPNSLNAGKLVPKSSIMRCLGKVKKRLADDCGKLNAARSLKNLTSSTSQHETLTVNIDKFLREK
jgi:hypothetical protein